MGRPPVGGLPFKHQRRQIPLAGCDAQAVGAARCRGETDFVALFFGDRLKLGQAIAREQREVGDLRAAGLCLPKPETVQAFGRGVPAVPSRSARSLNQPFSRLARCAREVQRPLARGARDAFGSGKPVVRRGGGFRPDFHTLRAQYHSATRRPGVP